MNKLGKLAILIFTAITLLLMSCPSGNGDDDDNGTTTTKGGNTTTTTIATILDPKLIGEWEGDDYTIKITDDKIVITVKSDPDNPIIMEYDVISSDKGGGTITVKDPDNLPDGTIEIDYELKNNDDELTITIDGDTIDVIRQTPVVGTSTTTTTTRPSSTSITTTRPPTATTTTATTTQQSLTATLSIRCDTVLANGHMIRPGRNPPIPPNGTVMAEKTVSFTEGESVFDVLRRETRASNIHMEFTSNPMFNSVYIDGINNLYEFDCGELSGWMYRVNGWFPNYGSSQYKLKQGDVIEWLYTCDLGSDIGGGYAAGTQGQ